jgi:deoxyguanosine kinase
LFVVIEGPAAAGKTELAMAFARSLAAECLLEPGDVDLPELYKDINVHPLRVQLYCLSARLELLRRASVALTQGRAVVADFALPKDRIYGEMFLSGADKTSYLRLFDALPEAAAHPDVLIYLDAPSEVLLRRVRDRKRAFEQHIDAGFIDELRSRCMESIWTRARCRRIMIDTTDIRATLSEAGIQNLISQLASCT